jgi:hypothetical protein
LFDVVDVPLILVIRILETVLTDRILETLLSDRLRFQRGALLHLAHHCVNLEKAIFVSSKMPNCQN